MSATTSSVMPYKGLMPYSDSQDDAQFFFGREQKKEIIIANLIASRLTLLYGPSGVGKSSVLRAGVAYHLREQAQKTLDEGRVPKFVVVVFDSWRDEDPLASLARSIQEAIAPVLPQKVTISSKTLIEDLLHLTVPESNNNKQQPTVELLVILDQFEEYFLYHAHEDGEGTFAFEFPRLINKSEIGINFLISMRDDSTTRLDRFKGRIPNLFANRLSVERLNIAAAREAIVKPLEQYNRLQVTNGEGVLDPEQVDQVLVHVGGQIGIEAQLVDEILQDVQTGQVFLGQAGRGTVKGSEASSQEEVFIETPFLQLVLTRLWEEEVAKGSRVLRTATLRSLGGAESIVKTHLDKVMNRLSRAEQDIAALIFYQLVTPSGTKIAHSIEDLVFFTKLPREQIKAVLSRLADTKDRILRSVATPVIDGDDSFDSRYEIFHDVLGSAVLDWRLRHEQKQEKERTAAAVERRRREEMAEAKRLAEEQKRQLDLAEAIAEEERRRAEQQQKLAEAERMRAEEQRSRVEAELQRAEEQRLRAEEHERGRRRARRLSYALAAMSLVAVGTGGLALAYGNRLKKIGDENTAMGLRLKAAAETERQRARESEERAVRLEQTAQALEDEGNRLKKEGTKLKAEGNIAKAQAAALRVEAVELRRSGEEAQMQAMQANLEAHTFRKLAEMAQVRAEEQAKLARASELRAIEARDEAQNADKLNQLYRKALLLNESGNAKAAIQTYEEAIPLYKHVGDFRGEAATRVSIGALYNRSDNQENAIQNLEIARKLYNQIRDDSAEAATLIKMGEVYNSTETEGAKRKAEESFVDALEIYQRTQDRSGEASALLKIGETYNQRSTRQDAISYFSRASGIYEKLGDHSAEATVLIEVADLLRGISTDEHLDEAERERAKQKAIENYALATKAAKQITDRTQAASKFVEIGRSLTRMGERRKSIELYSEARKLYEQQGLSAEAALMYVNIAAAYNTLGPENKRLALENYNQALPITRDARRQAGIFRSIGNIFKDLKNRAQALSNYNNALELYEKLGLANEIMRVKKLIKELGNP